GRIAAVGRRDVLPDGRDRLHHPVQQATADALHHRSRQSWYSAYSGVDRYRSPKDGITTTMVLPANSSRAPTRAAASMAAPEEIPTSRPSLRATSRARSIEVGASMSITSS